MYFVYVLYSQKDGKLYIGYSADVNERFTKHCAGDVKSTKDRRPLELIYYEAYLNETEAKRREKFLKGGNGRKHLKEQLVFTLKQRHYRFLSEMS